MHSLFQPLLAGLDPISWVVIGITVLSAGVSYVGYKKAKSAAQQQTNKTRGMLYSSRVSAAPRRFIIGRTRVGPYECYLATSGDENETFDMIVLWGDGPNKSVHLQLEGEAVDISATPDGNGLYPVSAGKFQNHVSLMTVLGTVPQTAMGAGIIPGWKDSDMLLGICATWLRFSFNQDVFPNGIPGVSGIVEGRTDIIDVRNDLPGYTRNAALAWNFYMTLPRLGPGVDYDEEINHEVLISSANICDELVPKSEHAPATGGSTGVDSGFTGSSGSGEPGVEERYTFDGIVDLDQDAEEIQDLFKTAAAGWFASSGARWAFYAGAYDPPDPAFVVNKSMIVGPVNNKTRRSKRDRFNLMKGLYANEATKWEPTSLPPYKVDAFITADKEELPEEIDLLNTNSIPRGRRILKINLLRSRFGRTVTVPCNILGFRAEPGKTVYFDFPELKYNMVAMDVLASDFSIEGGQVTVLLTLRETHPSIFDWDPYEDGDGSEDSNETHIEQPEPPCQKPGMYCGGGNNNQATFGDLTGEEIAADFTRFCKNRGGIAELIGHAEDNVTGLFPPTYDRPLSDPGMLYLIKTFAGVVTTERYTATDLNGCDPKGLTAILTAKYSGKKEYDPVSGDLESTSKEERIGACLDCTGWSAGETADIDTLAAATSADFIGIGSQNIIEEFRRTKYTVSGTGGCEGVVGQVTTGAATWFLTKPDTEEWAIDRLDATLDPWDDIDFIECVLGNCCFSRYDQRTGQVFDFEYSKSEGMVQVVAGPGVGVAELLVKLPLYRGPAPSGDGELIGFLVYPVTTDALGEVEFEFDVPFKKGYRHWVGAPTLHRYRT